MTDAGSNRAIKEKGEESQQMVLFNDVRHHQEQHSLVPLAPNFLTRNFKNVGGNRPTPPKNAARKMPTPMLVGAPGLSSIAAAAAAPPSPSTSCAPSTVYSIILEEGKDLPVFWNGENPVSLIKLSFLDTTGGAANKQHQLFATVHDFLSTYAAGRYLKKCTMSLQVSTTKYIDNLRMSDPYSRILENRNKDGRPITMLLTHANGDDGENGYSKFVLYIREVNGKKVLYGNIPTNRMVAKLNQSDMSLTIQACLQNYVAKGYLSQSCQVDLVNECSDTIRSKRVEMSVISMEDLVSTLFKKGNSASIVIRCIASTTTTAAPAATTATNISDDNNVHQSLEAEDLTLSSSRKIAVFTTPPTQCHWIGKTWGEIKDEVVRLVHSVEVTMRDTIIPTDIYASVSSKKRALETAIRRRCRVVDEVWRCYKALQTAHENLLNGNPRQVQVSRTPSVVAAAVARRTGGDVDNSLREQRCSCIDFLSSTLMRYGLELEIGYEDESSQAFSRIAGVGVGMAVAVVICTIVYYY